MRMRLPSMSVITLAALTLACGSSTSTTPQTVTYTAALKGSNEAPTPNTSTATGAATATLTSGVLTYSVTFAGLSSGATAGHIHIGIPGVAGPAIVGFSGVTSTSGTLTGTVNMTAANVANTSATLVISGDSLLKAINNGNAYVNIHSSNFPSGEIRGQLVKQ